MANLQALFQQSQELAQQINQAHLPNIALGLDQIEQTSRKLAKGSRPGVDAEAQSQGQYLFASKGINPSHLKSQIASLSTATAAPQPHWEAPIPIADTDVDGYRRWRQETIIIAALEQGRRTTQRVVQNGLTKRVREDWKTLRGRIGEELNDLSGLEEGVDVAMGEEATTSRSVYGLNASSSSGIRPSSSESKLQMHKKMMSYDEIVKRLNSYRKEDRPFAIISHMKEKMASSLDTKSPLLAETLTLLAHIVHEVADASGEFVGTLIKKRQYAEAYYSPLGDEKRTALTGRIIGGSKNHLEVMFWNYLEKQIAGRQAEAKLGGSPDVSHKVRAFVDLMLKDGILPTSMETVNGGYFWAQLFYLIRSGHHVEAMEMAASAEFALPRKDRHFTAYFKAWIQSTDKCLSQDERNQVFTLWNQHVKNTLDTGDPFRYALYKLIGRIEVDRKNVRYVISTMEDWMWYQLNMVREEQSTNGRTYTLADLGKKVLEFGPSHFITEATQNNPLVYVQNLFYTGQFEEAISFLHDRSMYHIDAVHMGIALAYYGLLRIPPRSPASDATILYRPHGESVACLNFARMIQRYIKMFSSTDPIEALQYIYLITLNSDLPDPIGTEQQQLCEAMVSNIVLDTQSYTLLLGEGQGTAQISTSVIGRDLSLIKVKDGQKLLRELIEEAAKRNNLDLPLPDLVSLLLQAGAYTRVLQTLARHVSDSLAIPSTAAELEQQDSLAAYVEQTARTLESLTGDLPESGKRVLKDLLHYRKVKRSTEKGEYQAALSVIEQESLLPLNKDVQGIQLAANEFRSRDELITRNIDDIVKNAMTCLDALYQAQKAAPYGGVNRQEAMEGLKKRERALMMFAGAIRHRLDAQTYQQLARTDAFF